MKLVLSIVLSLTMSSFLISCASKREKHQESAHHHHDCSPENCKQEKCEKYDKICAASLAHGDTHSAGKEEFMLTHKGHNYFFSSKKAMDDFRKNLDENIKAADRNWEKNRGHR